MSTSDTTELRDALRSAPVPAGLDPDPIDILRQGHRAQRRRRLFTGLAASTGAVIMAVAGFSIASLVTGPQPANEEHVPVAATVTVVPASESAFDIGYGWQISAESGQDTLCLDSTPESGHDNGGCILGAESTDDSYFGLVGEDVVNPVYVWVVSNTTDSAEVVSDTNATSAASVYEISALDLRIAVSHDLPMPVSGWSLISRDGEGTVTETIPVDYEVDRPPA